MLRKLEDIQQFSMLDLPPHEQLIKCPYNPAHQVVAKRMLNHLQKCRRSHSTKGTSACQFNVSHVYNIEEIAYHESECPDRVLVDVFVNDYKKRIREQKPEEELTVTSGFNSMESSFSTSCDIQSTLNDSYYPEIESWDSDEDTPTYDPKKAIQDKMAKDGIVIRTHIQHATPAERRRLREEQRFENNQIQYENDMKNAGKPLPAKNTSINWSYAEKNYDAHGTGSSLQNKKKKFKRYNAK